MRRDFLRKVIWEGIVDTRKYRYFHGDGCIARIERKYLGTTDALNHWEVVVKFEEVRKHEKNRIYN